MSKDLKSEFEQNPLKILSVSLDYFIGNEPMSSDLKEVIKENLMLLTKVPEGSIMDAINPFLEANIFEHDLKDLVECGIYSFIYSNALSFIAGTRE